VHDILAFAALAAAIVVVPGPDMALVLKNGLAGGRRAAVATSLGVNAGLVVWALAAALGLAALLRASSEAFTAVKLVGAAYLVWLGISALRDAWRGARAGAMTEDGSRNVSPFRQGLLSNLLNPKIAIVFTTLIPQSIDGRGGSEVAQTFVLAAVFVAMGLVWLTSYALLVARAGAVLGRPSVRRVVSSAAGTVLVALGVRVALERR
jgi:threonine/homoserine/homoserine lactone efflux protein